MSVQIPNCTMGVRRVEPASYDSHGSPIQGAPGAVGALLPGRRAEQDSGQWQLALDPDLWPVRIHDRIVAQDGMEWVVVHTKFIATPPLAEDEAIVGIDLDVSFIRVTGNQVNPAGTEPVGDIFVGRGDDTPPRDSL